MWYTQEAASVKGESYLQFVGTDDARRFLVALLHVVRVYGHIGVVVHPHLQIFQERLHLLVHVVLT